MFPDVPGALFEVVSPVAVFFSVSSSRDSSILSLYSVAAKDSICCRNLQYAVSAVFARVTVNAERGGHQTQHCIPLSTKMFQLKGTM